MTTSVLTLELGPEDPPTKCVCCGKTSRIVHGFVYRNGDAYSVYYAGWSEGHPDRGVTMAIAIGEWAEGSSASERVSMGLEARATETQIQFTVLNPEQSPWHKMDLLGEMLSREQALKHPALKEIFEVAEHVVRDDARVKTVFEQ